VSADLRAHLGGYLSEGRARGYELTTHEELINAFLAGLAEAHTTTVTIADALVFAQKPDASRNWQATRLRVITAFARYVHSHDPTAAELIPPKLITAKTTRSIPYLYTAGQISELMSAAAALPSATLADSMHTLIGLCAVTGMRSGEVFGLNLGDISDDATVLTVIGKNTKQRLVVVHPTTTDALRAYLSRRAARAVTTDAVLLGAKGGRLNGTTAREVFRWIVERCQLEPRPGCGLPRLHDMRHAFAVNTLIDAHRDGVDVDARIAVLANYLGHTDPANTYWYLTASPELMAIVADRMTSWQQRSRS
jgi:integrase